MTDAIRVIYVELSKLNEILKKSVDAMTDLEKWAVFFQYANQPKYRETVNQVIESKEVLQMAGNLLMNVSKDEKERAIFRSRRMYQTDLASNLATAEDRGIQRGKAEEKIEIARNLLSTNLPLEQIATATGLTCEDVERLRSH